jgi:cell division protein FtsW (lipid II flippase)
LTVAFEQAGVAGALAIAALMVATLAGMQTVAKRAGEHLALQIVAGASVMWLAQAAIHLAEALGALPRTGVTLPLVSYGGSSIVAFFMTLGLLAGASRPRLQREVASAA